MTAPKEPMWWIPPASVDEFGQYTPSPDFEYAKAQAVPIRGLSNDDQGLIVTRDLELWIKPAPLWSASADAHQEEADIAFRGQSWRIQGVGWYKRNALQIIATRTGG